MADLWMIEVRQMTGETDLQTLAKKVSDEADLQTTK
jgi:hypothetical protein